MIGALLNSLLKRKKEGGKEGRCILYCWIWLCPFSK